MLGTRVVQIVRHRVRHRIYQAAGIVSELRASQKVYTLSTVFCRERSYDSTFSNYVLVKKLGINKLPKLVGRRPEESVESVSWNIPEHMCIDRTCGGEITALKEQKRFDQIYQRIEHSWNENNVIDPELVLQILVDQAATDYFESPIRKDVLDTTNIEITSCYKICKKYQSALMNDQTYQEVAIRYAYLVDDFETLSSLTDVYLRNEYLEDVTVSHILNGFAYNYEVELAKSILVTVTNKRSNLNVNILESLLIQFIKAGALFENFTFLVQTWIISRNLPSAKAMATVLSEAYKYATPSELQEIEHLLHRYGLNDHHLIRTVTLKYQITNRDRLSFKKEILPEDLQEFDEISSVLSQSSDTQDLKDFYYTMMNYFVRYGSMSHIEHTLHKMKQTGVPVSEDFYKLLMKYYLNHGKFLNLWYFLESSRAGSLKFDLEFLKVISDTFVRSYLYLASDFHDKFVEFVKNSKLQEYEKALVLKNTRIKKLESQLHPFGIADHSMDPKKYKSKNWEPIVWKLKNKRPVSYSQQVKFRVEQGFAELLSRGIKPDFKEIEDTFRRLSLSYKTRLLELSQDIRMQQKDQNRLSLINLKFATTDELLQFFQYNLASLNANNKIAFSRILSNHKLYDESLEVLESTRSTDLLDSSLMVVLVYKMRVLIQQKKFDDITKLLDAFPLTQITISPYIIKQAIQMDRKILKLSEAGAEACIKRLRSFIGDCKMVLRKDESDLAEKLQDMFRYLDSWIESRETK